VETPEIRECEVCSNRAPVVLSAPWQGLRIARCLECFAADAIPLWIAVGLTQKLGMDGGGDAWRECVASTLDHLRIPVWVFENLVRELDDLAYLMDERVGS
jgi:hypothetical protein